MLKQAIYATSIIAGAMIMSGCSQDVGSSRVSDIDAHEGTIKIDRAVWEDVNRPGESSLGYLRKSIDAGDLEISLDKGDTVGQYIQFFIDSDHNEATGYHNDWVDGADYLIEEGRIYKSTADGDRWNWEKISNATFTKNNTTIYAKTTDEIIQNLNPKFRVAAVSWDSNWQSVSHITMPPLARGAITIDADVSDWANVDLFASSDVGEAKILDDNSNIYFLLEKGNTGNHTQIYLNVDNDVNTGYGGYITNSKIGAEYLIEDDRLYKSTSNGDNWAWENIGFVQRAKNGNVVEISISKNNVNVNLGASSITVGVVGWDATYDNDVSHLSMHSTSFQGEKSLVISEVLAANAHINLDSDFYAFSDWVELHNQSANTIDIGNYKLSDKMNKGKWTIPEGTTIEPNGYKIFWADNKKKALNEFHTNFKFKTSGEAVALFDAHGDLVDGFEFPQQKGDVSVGMINGQLQYMDPTPNGVNGEGFNYMLLSNIPEFSQDGGFYEDSETIQIFSDNGATIYYTTDGSFPTKESPVYNGGIDISETTTIRARTLENGKLLSDEVTQTYFIGESSTLPVISISTDNKYLWDDTIGIYAVGTNGIENDECEGVIANFMREWKRPAHVEYYDKNKNLGFSQEMEIKISGQCSRKRLQKSLALSADSKYGKDVVDYQLFSDKNINQFKSFKLRNGGQDWYEAMIRDALSQKLIKDDFNVDYQAYEPTIVFLNGKYWGIHNLREKRNEDYLASNYAGLNPKKVDILYSHFTVKEGKDDDYLALLDFIKNNPLSDDANYQQVASKIDIDNFIDYQIIQIYAANFDWPYNNTRYWKEQKDGAKWRWMMDDQDGTFGLFNEFKADHNTLVLATSVDSDPERNPDWSTFMLRKLLENDTFKSQFVSKFRTYLSTTFAPTRVKALVTSMKETIEPEMQRHIDRWAGDGVNNPLVEDMGDWNMFINHIMNFADSRADVVNGQLTDMFGN